MSLTRILTPRQPGEEDLRYTMQVPGSMDRSTVKAMCNRMTEMMAEQLQRTDWIASIAMEPTILRETVTGDGVDTVVLTAIAIIRRTETSRERFSTIGEQQADDSRRGMALAELLGRDDLTKDELMAEVGHLGYEIRGDRLVNVGEFTD